MSSSMLLHQPIASRRPGATNGELSSLSSRHAQGAPHLREDTAQTALQTPHLPFAIRALLFLGMLLITLHDVYYVSIGLPVVPIAGVVCIGLAVFLHGGLRNECLFSKDAARSRWIFAGGLLFVGINAFSQVVLVGESSITPKSPAGVLVGIGLLSVLLACRRYANSFYNVIVWLGRVHLAAWFLQFIVYRATGHVIDFIGPLGEQESRWDWGGAGVRLTGLFAEPALYSKFTLMILSIRGTRTQMRIGLEELLYVFSTLASFSLTGLGQTAVYVAVALLAGKASLKRNLSLAIIIAASYLAVATLTGFNIADEGPEQGLTRNRIENIHSDNSTNIRFVSFETFFDAPMATVLFGLGIGGERTVYYHSGFGVMLAGTGVLGILAIAVALTSWMRAFRIAWFFLPLFAVYLAGAPTITIPIFWMWLGLVALARKSPPLTLEQ